MPVVQDLADMYKAVDAPATVNLLAKLAVEKSYHAKLDDTRSSLAVSVLLLANSCGLWPNCLTVLFYFLSYRLLPATPLPKQCLTV